jgi:hypothetical protein
MKSDEYRVKLRSAAAHLGCRADDDAIVAACEAASDAVVNGIDPELDPGERLVALADRFSVDIQVVRSTAELDRIVDVLARQGELGFAARRPRFDKDLLAAVMRRKARHPGERVFVAVIDARGTKEPMAFFSKTHEVAHPMLEPQLAFDFREEVGHRDPWEALVDRVGAAIVFRGPTWTQAVNGIVCREPNFTIASLRELCDSAVNEASLTATALAAANTLRRALLVVVADHLPSKRDPVPTLRLARVIPNQRAAEGGVFLHERRRVPVTSPISRALATGRAQHGFENLSQWVDSGGRGLDPRQVWTAAMPLAVGSVYGLIELDPNQHLHRAANRPGR